MAQDTPTEDAEVGQASKDGMGTGLAAYLHPHILAGLDPDHAIIMLWSLDGARIYAASRPAIRFFGGFSSEDLTGRRFGPALPSTAKLAELARFLGTDEPARIERLRFFIGSRSDLLTCACRRIPLLAGAAEGLLVVSADSRNTADARGPARWLGPVTQAASLETGIEAAPDGGNMVSEPARSPEIVPAATPSIETAHPAAAEANAAGPFKALPRRPVRFVFQTDRAGRIEQISPQLAAIVGEARTAQVGETFADMDRRLGTSGGAVVAERIERGESWQGLVLDWPVGASALRVPVELSGLAIYDAGRSQNGFRGFGLIRLDAVSEERLIEVELEAKRSTLAPPPASPAPSPSPDENEPIIPAARPIADVVEMTPPAGANENAAILPESRRSPALVPPVPVSDADPERRLSQTDRNAFREIARALGARLADDMPDPPGMARRASRSEPPSPVGRDASSLTEATQAGARLAVPPPPSVTMKAANDPGPEAAPQPRTEAVAPEAKVEPEPSQREAGTAAEPSVTVTPDPASAAEAIIDHLPIGVLVARADEVLFVNRTLLELVGCADIASFGALGIATDLLGRGSAGATADADGAGIERRSIPLGDGSTLDVLAHLQPIDWQGGEATLVALRDAALPHSSFAESVTPGEDAQDPHQATLAATPTEDRAASESLTTDLRQQLRTVEAEREEFRAILDTATDGVISLDSEGRITGLNRSAEALFGFDQNDVAGQRFSVLLAGESHASALDYLEGLKSGGVASVLNDGREVIGREKKGGRIPLFMTLGRISERDSGRFCAVLRDLTAWKKAEAELTESKRVAERASQMKSDFLAKISHEIRTPMNAIIGFSEVMRTEQFGPIGSERYREYLGDIHRSGEHVISLVNDLLDLSKIEAGRAELSFTSVSLNEIVADCVSMMQPQAARDRVIMRSNLTEKMPRVVADERSIKQVVLNLLSNACKFNQPGGQVIISTALSDHDEAVIRVRDTGIGMSEKDIEGAMQPFRQMSPTRRGGGTGLGLPLTKALVEANRASLVLRSAVTEGTLAEVIFPATRVLAE